MPGSLRVTSRARVDPAWVRPVVDVTSGVRLAIDVLSEDAPVVFLVPGYSPQLDVAALTGAPTRRRRRRPRRGPGGDRPRPARRAARCRRPDPAAHPAAQPLGPGLQPRRARGDPRRGDPPRGPGRLATRSTRRWCCPAPSTRRTSTSRARTSTRSRWSPRRRRSTPPACAAPSSSCPTPGDRRRLDAAPMSRNDSWSPLGVVAAVAAYTDGDPWLASLVERLDQLSAPCSTTCWPSSCRWCG